MLDGATGATIWHEGVVARVIGSVVTADLTGDGYQDFLVPTVHGVEVLDGRTGAEVTVLGPDLGFQNAPLVTDDPNGTVGITIAGYDGDNEGVVQHYEIPGSNGALAVSPGAWPMFHHDPALSGASSVLTDAGNLTPAGLTAQSGDGQVSLSWPAPTGPGSPATGYNIYEGRAPGHEAGTPVNGSAPVTSTSYAATGLTNGKKYYFEVTAVGASGEGAPSNEASAVPAGPPGAPSGLSATAGDGEVSLSWAAPSSDGGSAVTGYNVYLSTTAGTEGSAAQSTLTATAATVPGLTDGATYYFEVTATNSAGEGHLRPGLRQPPGTHHDHVAGDHIDNRSPLHHNDHDLDNLDLAHHHEHNDDLGTEHNRACEHLDHVDHLHPSPGIATSAALVPTDDRPPVPTHDRPPGLTHDPRARCANGRGSTCARPARSRLPPGWFRWGRVRLGADGFVLGAPPGLARSRRGLGAGRGRLLAGRKGRGCPQWRGRPLLRAHGR